MGKPRMTALAVALRAVEPLSDEEKQTLRDVLRPAPKPRQKAKGSSGKSAQKRKAGKDATSVTAECRKCPNPFGANVHHLTTEPDYHEFSEKTEFTVSARG